jgi:SnoaL-like polyketide cyclase
MMGRGLLGLHMPTDGSTRHGLADSRATPPVDGGHPALPAVHAVLGAMNTGNLSLIDGALTADFRDHSAPFVVPAGPTGLKQVAHYASAILQEWIAIDCLIPGKNHVVVRATTFGVGCDDVHGPGSEGRPYAVATIHIFEARGTLLSQHWCERNELHILRQLQGSEAEGELGRTNEGVVGRHRKSPPADEATGRRATTQKERLEWT